MFVRGGTVDFSVDAVEPFAERLFSGRKITCERTALDVGKEIGEGVSLPEPRRHGVGKRALSHRAEVVEQSVEPPDEKEGQAVERLFHLSRRIPSAAERTGGVRSGGQGGDAEGGDFRVFDFFGRHKSSFHQVSPARILPRMRKRKAMV